MEDGHRHRLEGQVKPACRRGRTGSTVRRWVWWDRRRWPVAQWGRLYGEEDRVKDRITSELGLILPGDRRRGQAM